MTPRKSPTKHIVHSHKRSGKVVHAYVRGNGYCKNIKIANPTLRQELRKEEIDRLLEKLNYPSDIGLGLRNKSFSDLPSHIKTAILKEHHRELEIINKYRSDHVKTRLELIFNHAKRLYNSADLNPEQAWNTAALHCKYRMEENPFDYKIEKLTRHYIYKLDEYAEKFENNKKKANARDARFVDEMAEIGKIAGEPNW